MGCENSHPCELIFFSLLQIVLRPLFGNQPFFLQQESIIGQNIATQSSPTFANQLLTADDASQGTNATNSTKGRRRKTRRRENRFGRRGKLINSINHGKTSLTRYRKGELFSGPHETFSTFPIPNDQISLNQTGITTNILQDDLTIGQNLTISPNQTQVQLSNLSVDSNLTTAQATAQFSNQILGKQISITENIEINLSFYIILRSFQLLNDHITFSCYNHHFSSTFTKSNFRRSVRGKGKRFLWFPQLQTFRWNWRM